MADQLTLKVGTRDSVLARLQTDIVIQQLLSKFPALSFEITAVKTSGDKILNKPLSELGGRGVFVKELEESLLRKEVDFVVHSLKDLPTILPDSLMLAATIQREDPRDVLVSRDGLKFKQLPAKSRVATSSLRRAAQLRSIRNDLSFVDIRGNIQTRLRKLDEGQCDAMVLASAGLHRLELQSRIAEYFDCQECTPAVGQGALGIECHQENNTVQEYLNAINDQEVWSCIVAERAFLNRLGGGCSVPVGGIATTESDGRIKLQGCIASLDGKQVFKGTGIGITIEAEQIGSNLASSLVSQGAAHVLQDLLKAPSQNVSPP